MITVSGRHSVNPKPLRSNNVSAETMKVSDEEIILRIDDKSNLDFWMEVRFLREDLVDMIKKIDSD